MRPSIFGNSWLTTMFVMCLLFIAALASASPPNSTSATENDLTKLDFRLGDYTPGSDLYTINVPANAVVIAAQTTPPSSPPGTSTQTLISLRGHVSQVVAQRVGTLTLSGKYIADVNVFGGFSLTENGLTGGGSITRSFKVADQLDIVFGGFVQGTLNHSFDGGIVVGASLHFKS